MKVLVTGRAGSGKSATNSELQRLGLPSFDSDDVPGLAIWEELATGKKIQVDPSGFIDYSKVAWNWDSDSFYAFLKEHEELFLCGSASNQLDFHKFFDMVLILTLNPDLQRKYLIKRESEYGKDARMQDVIIEEQKEFVEQAVKLGGIAIDNNGSITETTDRIIEVVYDK